MFLWRARSGALAVADYLRIHGLQVNPSCTLCNGGLETITHILINCTLASQVWSSLSLPLPVNGFANEVSENIELVLQVMENIAVLQALRQSLPWLLWGIWKARNSTLYAGKVNDPNVLIAEEWFLQQSWNLMLIFATSRCVSVGQSQPQEHSRVIYMLLG